MRNYFKDIINLFTSSSQDEEMKSKFYGWLTDEQHAEEKNFALYEYWTNVKGSTELNLEDKLQRVYGKAGVRVSMQKKNYWLRPLRYVAAVAVLMVSVYTAHVWTKKQYADVATIEKYVAPGEMQLIKLPDETMVHINAGSLLLYPEKFVGSTRTVFLIGEANFKVKKNAGQPFIVRSSTMSVTALGTEFNVRAYADDRDMEATLLEGKVKVVCGNEGKDYILLPGEQVSYNKITGESSLAKVDVADATAWQRGELVFRSVTVKEIVVVLQRKFNVRFYGTSNHFNDDKYNFRFSDKASFDEVMKIIQSVVGDFSYRIEGHDCYIE